MPSMSGAERRTGGTDRQFGGAGHGDVWGSADNSGRLLGIRHFVTLGRSDVLVLPHLIHKLSQSAISLQLHKYHATIQVSRPTITLPITRYSRYSYHIHEFIFGSIAMGHLRSGIKNVALAGVR